MGVVECSGVRIWIVSNASIALDMLRCRHLYVRRVKRIVVTFFFIVYMMYNLSKSVFNNMTYNGLVVCIKHKTFVCLHFELCYSNFLRWWVFSPL